MKIISIVGIRPVHRLRPALCSWCQMWLTISASALPTQPPGAKEPSHQLRMNTDAAMMQICTDVIPWCRLRCSYRKNHRVRDTKINNNALCPPCPLWLIIHHEPTIYKNIRIKIPAPPQSPCNHQVQKNRTLTKTIHNCRIFTRLLHPAFRRQ